jgi:signal transduction histidine kinase
MVTAVTVTLVTLIAVLYVVTRNNMLDSYATLEQLELKEDVVRVRNALTAHTEALDTLTRDWAWWDDAYNFIETSSTEFIASNLTKQTFVGAELRIIVFINTNGNIVFGRSMDTQAQQPTDLPAALVEVLTGSDMFLQQQPDSRLSGILPLSEGALLIAARPLLNSDGQGPPRGTLIMARDFDDNTAAALSRITSLDTHIVPLIEPAESTEIESLRKDLLSAGDSESNVLFRMRDADTVVAFSLLHDVFDQPSHVLRIEQSRPIFASARSNLLYFLVSLVAVAVVMLLLVIYLLDRLVLLPLTRLNRHVNHIADSGDLALLYKPPGHGEIAQLADSIRGMLGDIRRTRSELEQTNMLLEKRVEERTSELLKARDAAVEALNVKDRILANVSHDSRTPLNTIMLRAELIRSEKYGPVTEQQANALQSIVGNVNQLTLFTTNLLYEAQSAGGHIDLHSESFNLDEELHRVADALRPLAIRKGLDLELNLHMEAPVPVHLNRHAVHQVVSNLVDNAIKFTDRGKVCVDARRIGDERVSISVSDTGKGIPEHLRSLIFAPFWQADSSVTREVNRGVGLGLSIVRLLVDNLGGSISVDAADGGGTVFTVVLPARID